MMPMLQWLRTFFHYTSVTRSRRTHARCLWETIKKLWLLTMFSRRDFDLTVVQVRTVTESEIVVSVDASSSKLQSIYRRRILQLVKKS